MGVPYLTLIAKEALFQLFNKTTLINTVSRDYENYVSDKGQTVTVILPETPAVQDAGAAFAADDVSPSTVDLTLDKWRESKAIKISSKASSMSEVDLMSLYAQPIANALAKDVESAIDTVAKTFSGSIGTNGTAPTGIGPIALDVKAKFDTALTIPDSDRFVVLAPAAETEYWKVFGLYTNSGNGGEADQRTGVLGTKFGMQYVGSPLATATNVAGYAYHKSGIVFASRPMQVSSLAQAGTMVSVNYNGIGLTVEAWHDPFTSADYIRGQMLFGVKKTVDGRGFLIKK